MTSRGNEEEKDFGKRTVEEKNRGEGTEKGQIFLWERKGRECVEEVYLKDGTGSRIFLLDKKELL